MRVRQLLGIFYPEPAQLQTLSNTFQYDEKECGKKGYTWFGGYCFEVNKKDLKEIIMKREYIGGEKVVYNVYAILEVD